MRQAAKELTFARYSCCRVRVDSTSRTRPGYGSQTPLGVSKLSKGGQKRYTRTGHNAPSTSKITTNRGQKQNTETSSEHANFAKKTEWNSVTDKSEGLAHY